MITPETIWLIDMGDEIAWCDEQFPDSDILCSDTEGYIKRCLYDEIYSALNEARDIIESDANTSDNAQAIEMINSVLSNHGICK